MRDVGDGDNSIDVGDRAIPTGADAGSAPRRRAAYMAPVLVALDMHMTQGDTGARVDGALGAYFTSGGGPA
jgi:hypothetical protein